MLLTRCDCCLVGAIVIVATMFGQSKAQNFSNTTIIDLSSPAAVFTQTIVVPRVPVLRFLLLEEHDPHVRTGSDVVINLNTCESPGRTCREVRTRQVEEEGLQSFTFVYGQSSEIIISISSTYKVGCKNYMYPQNATVDGSTNPAPVTLSCEPVPVQENASELVGDVTMEWRRFSQLEDLHNFVQNCSVSPENCGNCSKNAVVPANEEYLITDYNLTIMNPQRNQVWLVPSFTFNNGSTYPAPYTFLYRWPRITTHYEFSLEVIEPARNYSELKCEANSFPPMKTFEWTRGEAGEAVNIHSMDRYLFNNVTVNDLNGEVTITQVEPSVDNALFTCTVACLGGRLRTDVSLSVRLRVKGHLRPLWPAIGIIGVGILVAVFIIIGHFCDKAIEKYQNEPSNPSHHKRLQSTTSTMDNETSPNNVPSGKKQSASQADQVKYTVRDHTAVKRLSSARIQLLEEPQF